MFTSSGCVTFCCVVLLQTPLAPDETVRSDGDSDAVPPAALLAHPPLADAANTILTLFNFIR